MEENKIKKSLINLLTGIVKFLIYSYILMLIWNYLMPELFCLITLTYKKAILLHIMVNLINRDRTADKLKNLL